MSRPAVHPSISLYFCCNRQRSVLGECLAALSAAFPVCFLELDDLRSISDITTNEENDGKSKNSVHIYISLPPYMLIMFVYFLLAERACKLLPSLHEAFSEVEELAGTGPAARHALLTRVTEVTLPLLCSYISRWGEAENHSSEDGYCSSVTPKHSNALLGHILSTINAHLGMADSAWMKRLAGK